RGPDRRGDEPANRAGRGRRAECRDPHARPGAAIDARAAQDRSRARLSAGSRCLRNPGATRTSAPAPRLASMGEPAASLASVTHLRPVPDIKAAPVEQGERAYTTAELERWATVLRMRCVSMLAVAKSGHLDSSLSAADIVAALYYRVLRHDPSN